MGGLSLQLVHVYIGWKFDFVDNRSTTTKYPKCITKLIRFVEYSVEYFGVWGWADEVLHIDEVFYLIFAKPELTLSFMFLLIIIIRLKPIQITLQRRIEHLLLKRGPPVILTKTPHQHLIPHPNFHNINTSQQIRQYNIHLFSM